MKKIFVFLVLMFPAVFGLMGAATHVIVDNSFAIAGGGSNPAGTPFTATVTFTPTPTGSPTGTPTSTPTLSVFPAGQQSVSVFINATPNANMLVTMGGIYQNWSYFAATTGFGGASVSISFKTFQPTGGTSFNNNSTSTFQVTSAAFQVSGVLNNAPASVFDMVPNANMTPTPGAGVTLILTAYTRLAWKEPGYWEVNVCGFPVGSRSATPFDRLINHTIPAMWHEWLYG